MASWRDSGGMGAARGVLTGGILAVALALPATLMLGVLVSGRPAEARQGAQGAQEAEGPGAGDDPRRLVLVADPWCPYNCDPETGREGYMIEIARAVFEPAGYRVEYRLESWPTAIRLTEEGTAAGAVGAGLGDSDKLVFPEQPLGASHNGLAVKAGDPFAFAGVESLESRRMAVIRGYSYGPMIDEYVRANVGNRDRIVVVSGFSTAQLNITLRRLLGSDVDIVVDDANVLRWTVDRMRLGDRIRVVDVDDPDGVYIGFSPKHPEAASLARLLTDGVAAMRRDGRLAAILARYGLQDWTWLPDTGYDAPTKGAATN